MDKWSLDVLYKGYDDPTFHKDIEKLKAVIQTLQHTANHLTHDDEGKTLSLILKQLEDLTLLEYPLLQYITLRQSTDTTDAETISYNTKVMELLSDTTKPITKMNRYIADVEDLDTLIQQQEDLQQYAYLLRTTKDDAQHLLSNDAEEIISKLDLYAGKAWADLRDYLTSTVNVEYQGKQETLSSIRNMAYDSKKEVRKSAYQAELKAYEKIEDSIAFSLNSIKGQVNTLATLRGFSSPLELTLHQSHMKKETLDAMLFAMKEYLPKFHEYLKRKASLLGYQQGQLPWYDLFAPLGESHKQYSIEEAKQFLVHHFQALSQDMSSMIERAFDDAWIDFYPKKGKVGGAFCENIPNYKQSRILTNYNGTLGDVVTLAHELGHAYHGMMIEAHKPLNWNYSMPVAETASTFNENIIMNAAIDAAEGEEKLALIENQLQDLTQIICDIYSRFLFESELFERRKEEFLSPDELKKMMINAQKEAYKEAIDPETLHPYMWINKSHYYSADLSFYNFPYAFGGLFARGLYVKYQTMKDAFMPKYREMLKTTTVADVETVAAVMDIDLTDISFWREALDTAVERIDEFLALS